MASVERGPVRVSILRGRPEDAGVLRTHGPGVEEDTVTAPRRPPPGGGRSTLPPAQVPPPEVEGPGRAGDGNFRLGRVLNLSCLLTQEQSQSALSKHGRRSPQDPALLKTSPQPHVWATQRRPFATGLGILHTSHLPIL